MMEKSFPDVAENIKRIRENISKAMQEAGRTDSVRLMAVTKTVPPEKVNFAVSEGITLLGENKVQEFLEKCGKYSEKSEIHFIGGLQNNKVKYIIERVTVIQSVDSAKLADEISRRALAAGKRMDILLEVNIGKEAEKHGASPESLGELAAYVSELPNIRLRGLMTVPPKCSGTEAEKWFEKTRLLYDDLAANYRGKENALIDILSMGMSGDYEAAIRCGSTLVRIGSALFGNRIYL